MLKPTYSHRAAITTAGMTSRGSLSHCCSIPQPTSLQETIEQTVPRREQHREQDADEDLPDQVGREDREAKEALEPVLFRVQQQRQCEAQRQLNADRADGEKDGVPQRQVKVAVGEDNAEILQPDECPAARA